MRHPTRTIARLLPLVALAACAGTCSAPEAPPALARWLVPRPAPLPDPGGPPDDVRWAIERLLGRGLVDEDSGGRVVPALARTFAPAADGLTWTFTLRPGLTFANGETLRSMHVREAIERGFSRRDHATQRWLLRAVEGVSAIRPGRPLPKLGIQTPDDSTLIVRLARPDSLLPAALALPGVATPWRNGPPDSGWAALDGVGPYRLAARQPGRLTLVRRDPGPLPARAAYDTLWIRFATASRARALLRAGATDVAWPLPVGDPLREDAFEGYRWASLPPGAVRPGRRLELVMRADVAPTAKLAARRALAHSINRPDVLRSVTGHVEPFRSFWPQAGPFDFPRLDEGEQLGWMRRGRLGASFHTRLAFDPDEVHERVARRMQAQWARSGLSVDVMPLRGRRLIEERLAGRAQLLLHVTHGLLEEPATDLAMLGRPGRDAPVGRYRSGWAAPAAGTGGPAGGAGRAEALRAAQRAIEEATVVLPLGVLGWTWIAREGADPLPFHPRYGPEFSTSVTRGIAGR